ncbi:MAG: glycoside hydrolase family 92 protein [Verrucomicrobia bacterium]|nr:glycoside hydrolase family 92 protein [Verrucomicrobiota bacterium]MCG2681905.1 glycoside hydrolase family 92 protein [Kiritimatiellia bacterium]MBU4246745.1 glycoside hydrolase family 92 protein [Verrucomicrobiota bacterium]MBU4291166.1 glycoside hydrolase family 92 protein [Verrucomicrobiota bacterium]MBU4428298.1 glycoside hydrolase family 92 protein [Verrucomicrobiota bacterium]
MSEDIAAFVDPFLGNFETTVEKRPAGTLAASWQWLKAWPGNTHPGACRPFGMVSACAYTGGYPSGYGPYETNYNGRPRRLLDRIQCLGFTHFQHSGTGMIAEYYNYLLVTPLASAWPGGTPVWDLVDEQASAGYYAVTLGHGGVRAEVTVTPHGVMYRFRYPTGLLPRLRLDLPFNYREDPRFLDQPGRRGLGSKVLSSSASAVVRAIDGASIEGTIQTPTSLPLHFFCVIEPSTKGRWAHDDGRDIPVCSPAAAGGVQFAGPGSHTLELKIGFSLHSVHKAAEHYRNEFFGKHFDQAAAEARDVWNGCLSRIRIDAPAVGARQIFYSALYHSLIKPIDATGENPSWNEDRALFLDFATLWDQGKTQLPLVMALYPNRARDMINGLLNVYEEVRRPANMILVRPLNSLLAQDCQGLALSFPIIGHAASIGLKGINWRRALKILQDIFPAANPPEGKPGIDYALAAFSIAQVACAAGEPGTAKQWTERVNHWRQQYSRPGGKICKGSFYEGESWNYSFTVWHDVPALIEYNGGRENLIADLDAFFGYPQARLRPVHVATFGSDTLPEKYRFEGLNNESDMEVPYVYAYLGRHDRVCDVVRTVMKHRYTTGRGGLPGNDDSGGLSSWYVWSALGLFPAIAQGLYLIGSPLFTSAELDVAGGTFIIQAANNDETNIYVQSARLNGQAIDRPYLRSSELLNGGILELQMGARPTGWGQDLPPAPWTVGSQIV